MMSYIGLGEDEIAVHPPSVLCKGLHENLPERRRRLVLIFDKSISPRLPYDERTVNVRLALNLLP